MDTHQANLNVNLSADSTDSTDSTDSGVDSASQSGITLLLTILILAALSTIVFGLAAVTINEVRTSAGTTISEPVITADEAVNEDAMYALVRGSSKGSVSGNCGSPSTFLVNGVSVAACTAVYSPSPYTFNVGANVNKNFLFFNPSDWQGTSCAGGSGTSCPGYTSITVHENSGPSTNVYLCNWATVGCDPANDYGSTSLSSGGTWTSGALSGASQYQLVVDNSGGGSAGNFTMSTTTTTSPAYGPPSGTNNVTVSGTESGITRKIQSTAPQP